MERAEAGRLLAALAWVLAFLATGCSAPAARSPSPPPPPTTTLPPTPVCGNGISENPEECDDGNADNDDGCLVSCFRAANWIAGDPHTHSHGCFARWTPEELVYELRNRHVRIAAALVWGDGFLNDHPFFTGEDDPASRPDLILHYDLEVSRFPAAQTGHLVALGLRSIDFSERPFETPKSGIPVADWALAQGDRVVLGMAHGQFWPPNGRFPVPANSCCMPYELPIHVARGRISFLETEWSGRGPTVDPGTFLLWKSLLNTGFKLALAGASDFPCLNQDRLETVAPRTDVIVDGAVTYAGWLDGIRRGRTAVARGAGHINLRVNGAPLGSEVRVAAGPSVSLSIESRFPEPTVVEVLVNGSVATRVGVGAGSQVTGVPLTASSSFWVAARSPEVATSSIYVLVDGRPIRASAEDACYLVRYVDHLVGLAQTGQLPLEESADEALAAYAEARREFAERFAQAGGTSCP